MKRTITITILTMALTLGGYSKTTATNPKFENHSGRAINTEVAEKGVEPARKANERSGPEAAGEEDRKPAPQLISPICNGYCATFSPWHLFLPFIYWG